MDGGGEPSVGDFFPGLVAGFQVAADPLGVVRLGVGAEVHDASASLLLREVRCTSVDVRACFRRCTIFVR